MGIKYFRLIEGFSRVFAFVLLISLLFCLAMLLPIPFDKLMEPPENWWTAGKIVLWTFFAGPLGFLLGMVIKEAHLMFLRGCVTSAVSRIEKRQILRALLIKQPNNALLESFDRELAPPREGYRVADEPINSREVPDNLLALFDGIDDPFGMQAPQAVRRVSS